MTTILQGSLRHFPAAEILELLGSHAHTGTLTVDAKGTRTSVVFHDGLVASVQSNADAEPLDALYDLFSWETADFAFASEAALPPDAKPLSLEHRALIDEGKRRAAALREVIKLYPDPMVALRVVDDPGAQDKISLSAEQFKLLFRIGQGKTVEQIGRELKKRPTELYPLLHELESHGLLTRGPAPEPEVTGSRKKTEVQPEPEKMPASPFTRMETSPKASTDKVPAHTEPQPKAAPPPPPPPATPPIAPHDKTRVSVIREKPPAAPPSVAAASSAAAPRPTRSTGSRRVGSLTQDGPLAAVFPLIDDEYTIGRLTSNAIAINDASVSSRHARINRTKEGFVIEDLKSRNGTFVNGERVNDGKRLLADNDLVRLGKVLFTFNLAAEEKAGEPTKPEQQMPR
jgi:hypothetical protein